jgi:hypothetical protein
MWVEGETLCSRSRLRRLGPGLPHWSARVVVPVQRARIVGHAQESQAHQAEAMVMVAIQVIASDVAVTMGGAESNFELNAFRPVLIASYLHPSLITADMCDHFCEFMIESSKLSGAKLKEYIHHSVVMVTAISPLIGCDQALVIAD